MALGNGLRQHVHGFQKESKVVSLPESLETRHGEALVCPFGGTTHLPMLMFAEEVLGDDFFRAPRYTRLSVLDTGCSGFEAVNPGERFLATA